MVTITLEDLNLASNSKTRIVQVSSFYNKLSMQNQEALDCSYPEEKDGCRGGWYTAVWRYIQESGRMAALRDIPYFPAGISCIITL